VDCEAAVRLETRSRHRHGIDETAQSGRRRRP
jgi:hypothetical protein